MSSQRILQVITRSDWGGAPQIVESLSTRIEDVTAVACGPDGLLIDRLEEAGVPVHVQPHLQSSPHPRDVLAYRDLRTLLTEGNFDLVHAHSTKAGALARIAAARNSISSVFTVHGWGFYNTEYNALRPIVIKGEQFLARRTEKVICVSENDRQEGQKRDIVSEDTGEVIHNGIPPLHPHIDRNTLYEEFDIDTDTPIIGAIARLVPQKNPLEILETAKELSDRGHDFATILIGSGPLAEDCQEFIDYHNLENVYVPGFRDDVQELLFDFDIFLLPSRFEGFPLTVLECLHAGVPLVANDVGGVAEAIDDSVTGFVVNPNAIDNTFTDRVEILLSDPRRRQKMSNRAQQVAVSRFTEQRMIADYQNLYDALLT
jgi:glycosyltransferase involved in cell wall biosynthesis